MFETLLLILGGIVLIAVAILYGAFAWGFVLWKFWYWFILPVFPTLPTVTLVQCVGLMMIVGLFDTNVRQIIKKEYTDEKIKNWAVVLAPPITFLVGWLIKITIVH